MMIPLGGYAKDGGYPEWQAGVAVVLFVAFLISCVVAPIYACMGILWIFGFDTSWGMAGVLIPVGVLFWNGEWRGGPPISHREVAACAADRARRREADERFGCNAANTNSAGECE